MTILRIPHIHAVRSKGRIYYYHRHTREKLPGKPSDPEFITALAAIEAKRKATESVPAVDGTFAGVVRAYLASPEYLGLADRTRGDYRKVLDYLVERMGKVPLVKIDGPAVFAIRDKTLALRKRRFANYVVQMMSAVFSWAQPRGFSPGLAGNPARDVPMLPRPKGAPIANRAWSGVEVAAVLNAASPALRIPIALGAYLGARQGDVLRMTWSAFDGQGFTFTQSKTGAALWLPAHAYLRELLRTARRDSPVIVLGKRGKPFTSNGFQREFFKLIRRLEAADKIGKGLTFHGLRHTVGKHLADAGCDTRDIQAWLGHATATMAEHYAKEADQKRRVKGAVVKLQRAQRRQARAKMIAGPKSS
jgi:integrase